MGKAVLEHTEAVERVIKLEMRTNRDDGTIVFALVQSIRVNTADIPYDVPPTMRDILVASPEALSNFIQLLNSDKLWEELERLLPGTTQEAQK